MATGQDLGRTLAGELSGVQHTKEAAVLGFTVDRTRTAGLQESDRRLDRGVVQADAETGREAAEVNRGRRIQRNVERGQRVIRREAEITVSKAERVVCDFDQIGRAHV